MIADSEFQISDSRSACFLAEYVCNLFQTRNVYEIAAKSGVKIVYQKWFPVTFGEFDRKKQIIVINENAPIAVEKIIAHELGHFFVKEFAVKITNEETFCDEFADVLLKDGKLDADGCGLPLI